MHVDVSGPRDGTPLVLLHGGAGTGIYHWSKPVRLLQADYRVHLPDLPGHGHSRLASGREYTLELIAAAVASYVDEIGGPIHLGGFSMGGHALLSLAQARPDLFASLTLIGVSLCDHEGLRDWRVRFQPDRLERDHPGWVHHLSRLHFPLGGAEAWRDVCRRDAGLQVDVDVAALDALDCPVLLVRGDRDTAVDPGHYAELRARWPHADELVVPAGGHDVQLTRSRVVTPALVDFLMRATRSERLAPP